MTTHNGNRTGGRAVCQKLSIFSLALSLLYLHCIHNSYKKAYLITARLFICICPNTHEKTTKHESCYEVKPTITQTILWA